MSDIRLNAFKDSLQILELIDMAGARDNPDVQELYEWSQFTGFNGGRIAAKASTMLANQLIPQGLQNLLAAPEDVFPELMQERSQKVHDILQDYRAFLDEIIAHPTESIVSHYLILGWSRGRGNRVKAEMLAQDLLETEVVRAGQGRPKEILKPSTKAKELFGL